MQSRTKNILKIGLDVLVAVIFAVLFDKTVLGGMAFHEIAGLAVGAFISIHMIQHRAWLKAVARKLFTAKLTLGTSLAYVVDIMLVIDIAAIIVTGILMSKVVFAGIISVHANVKGLHKAASYLALLLMGVHVGLSWKRVIAIVNQWLRVPKKRILRVAATVLTLTAFVVGTYNIVSTGYVEKVAAFTTAFAEGGGGERDFKTASSEETSAQTTSMLAINASTSASTVDAVSSASLNNGGAQSQNGGTQTQSNTYTQNSDTQTQDSGTHTMLEGSGSGGPQGGQNGNGEMRGEGGHQSGGILAMLYQNLSILAFFAIVVYQIDKIFRFRRRKNTKLQPA